MGRMLLHVESFFRTLHRAAALREDAQWARTWLHNVSSKHLLLLSLAADGADTLMQLCRFFDSESCDPAALNQEIGFFMSELDVQFRERKVWDIDGYSKHLLSVLREGKLYTLTGGQGKNLVVTDGIKRQALSEFQAWLPLCEATVRAEFPDFEILNSMCVFNLPQDESVPRGGLPDEMTRSLRRLAQALQLDPFLLHTEWEKLRPMATAQKKSADLTIDRHGHWLTPTLKRPPTCARNMVCNVCLRLCKLTSAGVLPRTLQSFQKFLLFYSHNY